MATTRYANAAGSNTAPYNTVANGATDPQTIIDLAVAGDTNLYYGTFTLAAVLDFDTNAGSIAAGLIKHQGCNAAGVADGTLAIFNAASVRANCCNITKNFHLLQYLELKLATGHGVTGASDNSYFLDLLVHNCGSRGLYLGNNSNNVVRNCKVYSNTHNGIDLYIGNVKKCICYLNGQSGINLSSTGLVSENICYSNTVAGITVINCQVLQNTCYANPTGIVINSTNGLAYYFDNRLSTNTNYAIYVNASKYCFEDWNKFNNNGNSNAIGTGAGALLVSGGHSIYDSTEDMVAPESGNFNLKTGTQGMRWSSETLIDGVSIDAHTAGLDPIPDFPDAANIWSGDTTDGVAGTEDQPALNKVAPSATLRGSSGTMDIPAIANVRDNDTLEGVPGEFDQNKIYTAADSEDPGVANVNVDVVASYKINGVTKTPTFSEAARNKFNTGTTVADLLDGESVKLLNVDHTGTFDAAAYALAVEATRNTALSMAVVKKDAPVRQFGVDDLGELVALPAPDIPTNVVATTITSSKIRISWDWSANTASIEVEQSTTGTGGWSNIATLTSGNYYDKTGLTASTKYYYRVRSYNAVGGYSSYSSIVNATTKATLAYLTRIENNLIAFIESFATANGYFYNWGSADQRDLAKALEAGEFSTTIPCAWMDMQPIEENVDGIESSDSLAYQNVIKLKIWSAIQLSAESSNPKESYKIECAKMLEDLKLAFGNNITNSVEAAALFDELQEIKYNTSEIEWHDKSGDQMTPGYLRSEWGVTYIQQRMNPNQYAY